MDYSRGNSSARHSSSKQGTPRNDKHQPIIIQNFELLTPGQLKFKRKSLSTANLFLSSASLSRHGTKENRPVSEQSARVYEHGVPGPWLSGADPFAHQSPDLALRAQIDNTTKPSPLSFSSNTDKTGPRKQVTFADALPTSYSLATKGKLWHTGNTISDSIGSKSNTDINNNNNNISSGDDVNTKNSLSRYSNDRKVKREISSGSQAPANFISSQTYGRNTTSDMRPLGLVLSGDTSLSGIGRGRTLTSWHSENDHSSWQDRSIIDHKLHLNGHKKHVGLASVHEDISDNRGQESNDNVVETAEQGSAPTMVDSTVVKREDSKPFADSQKDTGQSKNQASDQFLSRPKKVSFNFNDKVQSEEEEDGDDDKNSVTADVGDTNDLWYEAERSENQAQRTPSESKDQDNNKETSSTDFYMVPTLLDSAPLPAYQGPVGSKPSSARSSCTATPVDKSTKPEKNSPTKSSLKSPKDSLQNGSAANGERKIIRLNFLKDVFDIYRRPEDPLHPSNQQKLEKSKGDGKDIESEDMNVQGYALHSDLSNSEDKAAHPKETNAIKKDIGRNRNQHDSYEQQSLSNGPDSGKPKSQGELNTDFLMQMYSASGDRRACNEVAAVSAANEVSQRSEARRSPVDSQGSQRNVRSSEIDRQSPGHQRDSVTFSTRFRDKERRLLSAAPLRSSRSLERPRFRSSSARTRQPGSQERMSAAEKFLVQTNRRMAERTTLNKRLEDLVVSSIQFNRSRTGLERSRTNLM